MLAGLALMSAGAAQAAAPCHGNPNALGTSRTIVVDPRDHVRIGTMSYTETLPLADKEVVLTFDDGPLPPHSDKILDMLAAECVKATYFIVGAMAKAYPHLVRRTYDEGHTIGTHSQNHPLSFNRMSEAQASRGAGDLHADGRRCVVDHDRVAVTIPNERAIPGVRGGV